MNELHSKNKCWTKWIFTVDSKTQMISCCVLLTIVNLKIKEEGIELYNPYKGIRPQVLWRMLSFLQSKPTRLKRAIEDDNVGQTFEILKQQNSLLDEYCVSTFPSLFSLRVSDSWSNTDCSYNHFTWQFLSLTHLWQKVGTFHQIIIDRFDIPLTFIWTINSFNQTDSKRIWDSQFIFVWSINSFNPTDSKRIWDFYLICF